MSIVVKLSKKANVKVSILNSANKTVRTFTARNVKKKKFTWNGKNTAGEYVAAGKYKVKVKAGKKTKTTKAFFLKPSRVFSGGAGTKANPYKVQNSKQLKSLDKYNGCAFIQVKDINMNCEHIWIGTDWKGFVGNYNGNGYSINKYMYSNMSDELGSALFYKIGSSGVVHNVTMNKCFITTGNLAGGIAVYNYGTIKNCKVNGTIETGIASYDDDRATGMICACNKTGGKIINCASTGTISEKYVKDFDIRKNCSVGGIVGYNEGMVNGCISRANVAANAGDDDCYAGGVVGKNRGAVMDCDAYGSVEAYTAQSLFGSGKGYSGGIVGYSITSVSGCSYYGEIDMITGDVTGKIYGKEP